MWRVVNVFRAVLWNARTSNTPIASFLGAQGTDALSTALFPQDLRNVLTNNEQTIINSGQPWQGRTGATNLAGVQPYPGINIAHAGPSNLR